jgi:hypothetical protein
MIFIVVGVVGLVVALAATAWMAMTSHRDSGRTYLVRRSSAGPRYEVSFSEWRRRYLPQSLGWSLASIAVGLVLRRHGHAG